MINPKLHTPVMTQRELRTAQAVLPSARNALQLATLEARLRTGQRISTAVQQGRWYVCLVLYRIGRNGEPVGESDIWFLTEGVTEESATHFIKNWQGDVLTLYPGPTRGKRHGRTKALPTRRKPLGN